MGVLWDNLPLMICIVVFADSDVATSTQLTWTPSRPSLTELIVILDVRGRVESLTIVISTVELIVIGSETPPAPPVVTVRM